MSCCGKKREDLRTASAFTAARNVTPKARSKIVFEYTGNAATTVIGAVSRLRYTFIKPGSRVEVDARDHASLTTVPHLRRIT